MRRGRCGLSRRVLLCGLVAAGIVDQAAEAAAQVAADAPQPARAPQPPGAPAWPSRPLRIVVPFAVGGTTDRVARLLAPELQRSLGQPVGIDNKPGAEGRIGSAEVAKSVDGHTLLMGTVGTHAINPALARRLPYDPVKDFAPVALVATVPLVLVLNPGFAARRGIHSVADLVRVAGEQPGQLHLASGGIGSPSHLTSALFRRLTQTDMLHFPYRSGAPAQQDVIAGNMDLMFDSLPAALPKIRAGRLYGLAVTGTQRSPSLPELPTLEEAGGAALKGFEASVWFGLLAPSHQPFDQLARLQREAAGVLAAPALREQLEALGVQPLSTTPAEFSALMLSETAKWARVVRLAGVKVDP